MTEDDDLLEMTSLEAVEKLCLPADPAQLFWPPTLAVECALGSSTVEELKDSYKLDDFKWSAIIADPAFRADVARIKEALKTEGHSFRLKAGMQAEALLESMWRFAHDEKMPPAVRADIMKFIVRASGLSAEKEKSDGGNSTSLQINISL